MNNSNALAHPVWATASHADAGRSQPMEMRSLSAHLGQCLGARGRWFGVGCVAESVHGFVAPRLVTTLTLAALVLAATSLFG